MAWGNRKDNYYQDSSNEYSEIAELVGDDVVLLWRNEFHQCFLARLCDDHFDVFADYEDLVSILDDFVGEAKNLFCEKMCQGHSSYIVHIYLLNDV